jgi:hypothetical protein
LQHQFAGNCNTKKGIREWWSKMPDKQEAFAGLALGTVVGLLVGMSNIPVTAIVVLWRFANSD